MKLNFEEWWYKKIFREFIKPREKAQEYLWLTNCLKKLKLLLEITSDLELVKSTIIILLNLLRADPLDNFAKFGKNIKYLPLSEREKIKDMLKETLVIERIEEN
jgi:hypothetical protein